MLFWIQKNEIEDRYVKLKSNIRKTVVNKKAITTHPSSPAHLQTMFEVRNNARWAELADVRQGLARRLDVYQNQYRAKEAQYAELGVVRKRNLEKVLRTLERQEQLSTGRKETLQKDYTHFQSQRQAVQSTLDGTSYAQRSLLSIQKTYYERMQRSLPSWEEHKTKLKLKRLSELQAQKTSLEEQRQRVSELSKYNSELDARLHQASTIVHTLERQVFDESSEQMDRRRIQQKRRENDLLRRRQLEADVSRALEEQELAPLPSPSRASGEGANNAAAGAAGAPALPQVATWTAREVCATLMVLRRLLESRPTELRASGYADVSTRSHWHNPLSLAAAAEANEWIAAAALDVARKQNQNGNRVPSSSSSSASGDPILRAAGMSQWCSAFLHVVRVFSERLLPPVMVRPHTSMSNVHTPLHLKHLMDEFRIEGQTAVSTSIDLSCLFCYCIVSYCFVLFRIVSS